MTYFQFLGIFILVPLLVLLWSLRKKLSRLKVVAVGTISLIAILYTTLWDNYLVANRIWWYDPDLVTGVTLGWVPIEEYLFFILETILVGLWFLYLWGKIAPEKPADRPWARWMFPSVLGLIWVIMAAVLILGWSPGRYLALELVWALPPIMLQLAYGADLLLREWRAVTLAILSATLYLSIADWIAIRAGIWTISPRFTLGIIFGRTLPLEEAVFFLLTATLVVFGVFLIVAPESHSRLIQAWARVRKKTFLPSGVREVGR